MTEEVQPSPKPVLAILLGGLSSRMGVRAKGRLLSPLSLTPIVEHLVTEADQAGLDAIFVGEAGDYVDLATETPRIPDAPCAQGPLAGVIAAAEYAAGRTLVLIGCDMPYVRAQTLQHLLSANPWAIALAPWREERWEPLFSRWESHRLSEVANRLATSEPRASLQRLFAAVDAARLTVDEGLARALHDWDSPSDREL